MAQEGTSQPRIHRPVGNAAWAAGQHRLCWLSDVIAVPGTVIVVSIGDLLLIGGITAIDRRHHRDACRRHAPTSLKTAHASSLLTTRPAPPAAAWQQCLHP